MSRDNLLQGRAAACCRSGRCEGAISALEELLQGSPLDPGVHHQLGVCYGGCCREHSLVQPEVAVEHLLTSLRLQARLGDELQQAKMLADLGHVYVRATRLQPRLRMRSVIECLEKSASIYLKLGRLECWAREQYNLGNAFCELPEDDSPSKWRDAIGHYELALRIRTRSRSPELYAVTLQNMGSAYRELPDGDRLLNVRKAIDCYRRAIRVFGAATHPLGNAALHNNLGNAYLSLPDGGASQAERFARLGLRHFERALRIWTKEGHRCDYARVQFNRASALIRLASSSPDPERLLDEALHCFEEAVECWEICGQVALAENARLGIRRIKTSASGDRQKGESSPAVGPCPGRGRKEDRRT